MKIKSLITCGLRLSDKAGSWLWSISLRLLLAYEFWESGQQKFTGSNWFADIQNNFPFPFNLLPTDISWLMATWLELLGSIALVLGLGTRFFSLSLIIVTLVAWASVHAGQGYNVCDNGYKMALIYIIMLLPLVFNGAGKLSLDRLLWSQWERN